MSTLLASAVFDSHEEAQRAVTALREAGVPDSSLSVIARHGNKTTTTAGDGEVTQSTHRYERKEANLIVFTIPVPAGQEVELRYTARVRW